MKQKDNIIFWGEDSYSNIVLQSIIEAGYNILLVITPRYNNAIYKRLEITCKKYRIPFERYVNINSDEVYYRVKNLSPDLCVIAHFQKLISEEILLIPSLGFINLHPSLLPNYRGMAPQHWPIINGDKETGVTVHYVDKTADTGDIIIQIPIPISSDMYVSDLQNKWIGIYKVIVIEAIKRIKNNYPVIVQRNLPGSYYGKLLKEQCKINLNDSTQSVYNLIRGVSLPYFGAECNDVIIWRAHHLASDLEKKIMDEYFYNGNYLNTKSGDFLKLNNGVLLIDKYSHRLS